MSAQAVPETRNEGKPFRSAPNPFGNAKTKVELPLVPRFSVITKIVSLSVASKCVRALVGASAKHGIDVWICSILCVPNNIPP